MSPLVLFHLVTGTAAVLAGAVALFSKKGGSVHRLSGKVFVLTMIGMAASGGLMGCLRTQLINVIAGGFTVYLVVSSWHAVQHKLFGLRVWKYGFPVFAVLIMAVSLYAGFTALASETGGYDGYIAEAYFFFAGLASIALITDVTLIFRGNIAHKHRVARHLWRMCLAFYIAAGSLFEGPGAIIFPEAIHNSGVLAVPTPLILVLMLFWLGKTLIKKRSKAVPA